MSGYPEGVEVVDVDQNHVLATYRNVVICVWLGETRSTDVDAASNALADIARRHTRGVGLVQVIESGARSLNADARGALASLLNRGKDYIRASAVVCDGEGFRSAAVRMIVSGLVRLSNPGFSHHVYADTKSAAQAVAQHLSASPSDAARMIDGIMRCIAELRLGAKEALAPQSKAVSVRSTRR